MSNDGDTAVDIKPSLVVKNEEANEEVKNPVVDPNDIPIPLPEDYRYALKENTEDKLVVYSSLDDASDCDKWIARFQSLSGHLWNVRYTKPQAIKIKFRKDYICKYSSFNKLRPEQTSKKSNNLGCDEAQISIIIKLNSRNTRYRHKHVRDGLPAIITIKNKHCHS